MTRQSDGLGAPQVLVHAWQWNGTMWQLGDSALTGSLGGYTLNVAGGNYRLEFQDFGSAVPQLQYECYSGAYTLDSATDVPAGSVVNIALKPGGHITGTLTDKTTGQPIANATVYEKRVENGKSSGLLITPRTDSTGFYDLGGLPPGTYHVHYSWDWQAYYHDAFTEGQATDIVVGQGATASHVDQALGRSATVTGTVTDQGTGLPVQGIYISVSVQLGSTGVWVDPIACSYGVTDASGNYTIDHVPADAGVCRVEFFDTSGQYIASFYHGAGSVGSAQNVAVTPGGTTTGINEQMSKPVHPYSLTDSSSGINLGFTNLTGGTPSMSPQQVTLPSTAANFQLVGGACYDIHPSATYAGLVTVTIPYDPAQVAGDAWALKMLHYEGGTWKDITVSVDTLNHTVTGQTTSFSDFGVFEPHGSGSGGAPTSTPASSNWSLALLALSALGVVALVGRRVRNTSGA